MLLEAAGAVGIAEAREVTVRGESGAASLVTDLVRRAQAGETCAFEQLMLQYQKQVLGTAARILRRREDAKDAAQEVFLKLYRHLARIRPEAFRTWLYRVTVHVCCDMLKKSERFPSSPLDENAAGLASSFSGSGEIERRIGMKEELRILHNALQSLPFKERAALVLRDIEGLSAEEAGSVLGSSAATVRSQVSSARVKVRRYCERAVGRAK